MKDDTTVHEKSSVTGEQHTVALIDNITDVILCRHLILHVYVSHIHSLQEHTYHTSIKTKCS